MKYIRTKDRIYNTGKLVYAFDEEYLSKDWNKDFEKLLQTPIIKQADTIPELCDAYVITSKQGHIYDSYGDYGYELKEVLPQVREEEPDEDWDLYGCILVDGIIKQVAKLNDEKGELELL